MAAFKHKASYDSTYGHPLPFRSREAAHLNNLGNQHVSWAPINPDNQLKSHITSDKLASYSSADKENADKENVKSWLDTTSPTSVLNSHVRPQQHVQSEGELNPPTPSPVCSPSPSSPLSSPRSELRRTDIVSPAQIALQNSSNQINFQAQSSVKKIEELGSSSKRHGKDVATEAPPDSPTGSSFSSGSEGGLLALLTSKLLSYKENGRRFSRYSRESSGPIDEKHVMEDRSKKPSVEEIRTVQATPPIQEPLTSNGLYRTSSEAVSEFSLGSANGRTLSMEFDAMLVAAAATTGIGQASALQDQPQQPLPEIQEDVSTRVGSFGVHQHSDTDSRALVRVGAASSDDEASRLTDALTVMRQGRESEDMDFNSTLSEWPLSSRSSISSGSRRGILEHNNMQLVPTTALISVESSEAGSTLMNINRESSVSSSSCGSNGDHNLAMVLVMHDHASGTASDPCESMLSSSSSSSICKDKNMAPITTIPVKQALEKVRREKVLAQALAFQDAKNSKCNNRYRREESKIIAWENQQRIKASIRMKKVEMRLEQKRAKALEKMQNEIAEAHKTAEERKASAEAVRAAKTTKVAQLADSIRRSGKLSSATNVGCFPF